MSKTTTRQLAFRVFLAALAPILGLVYVFAFMDPVEQGPSGQSLYESQCANCHGKDGKGLRSLYPPLAQSDYLDQHSDELACIIYYGLEDTIIVNGKTYNQAMAGLPKLSNTEIAKIITYVNNSWGNEGERPTNKEVKKALQACPDAKMYQP